MRSILSACLLLALVASVSAQYQTNQAEATLTLNGVSSTGAAAAEVSLGTGVNAALTFSSNSVGLPYDLFFNGAAQIAAPPGLLLGTQLVNVDIFGGGLFFLSGTGAGFTVPGLPFGGIGFDQTLTIPCVTPGTLSIQSYAVAPAIPGAVALSSAVTLNCFQDNQLAPAVCAQNPAAIALTLTDDSFSNQPLVAPFTFYGVTYSDCFVGSNGFVSFGAGNTDFSESVAEFDSGPARICQFWDDFNPAAGGQVFFYSDANGFQVFFNGVFEFGTTLANTIQLDVTSSIITASYCVQTSTDGIVGLTPGGLLGAGVAQNWSLGALTLNPAVGQYELFDFSNTSDLNGFSLNWILDSTGGPVASF